VQLFNLDRVEKAEASKEFIEWSNRTAKPRKKLSDLAKQRADMKREELIVFINSLNINVPVMKLEKLIKKAVEHYNDLQVERGNYDKEATINDSPKFLARISANMLRHEFSDYDDELDKMFGKVGRSEGAVLLRERVMNKIFEVYPWIDQQLNDDDDDD